MATGKPRQRKTGLQPKNTFFVLVSCLQITCTFVVFLIAPKLGDLMLRLSLVTLYVSIVLIRPGIQYWVKTK